MGERKGSGIWASDRTKCVGPFYLTFCVLVWYSLAALYSVYNKAVLQMFPYPITVVSVELGVGVLLVLPAWVLGIIRPPSLTMSQMPVMFRVALWHAVSHAANSGALRMSSLAAVSAVQAAEPLSSALAVWLMAGESTHPVVNASLGLVVLGVFLAAGESSLTWGGLLLAGVSSAGIGIRGVYAVRARRDRAFRARPLSAANTYAIVTVMSFATILPYACIFEGPAAAKGWGKIGVGAEAWTPAFAAAEVEEGGWGGGDSLPALAMYLGVSGVLFFLNSMVAFAILTRMGSVTFSVFNSVRRGVIVLGGVIAVRASIGLLPGVGVVMTFLGTGAYSVAKIRFPPHVSGQGISKGPGPRQ